MGPFGEYLKQRFPQLRLEQEDFGRLRYHLPALDQEQRPLESCPHCQVAVKARTVWWIDLQLGINHAEIRPGVRLRSHCSSCDLLSAWCS